MASLFLTSMGHFPLLGTSCNESCCTPPSDQQRSHAVYLQGSGGIDITVVSPTQPFNTLDGEMLDFDAVFLRAYDSSTFSLHVGCGGCAKEEDGQVPSARRLVQWQKGQLEPFTQTAYYSAFPSENRTINATLLSAENCPQAHFTVRLVDYNNRTDKEPLIWVAFIGRRESFTALELLSFPTYIVRNHGRAWNRNGEFLFMLVACAFSAIVISYARSGERILRTFDQWRELFYLLSCTGFVIAICDELMNLIYAQSEIEIQGPIWLFLFLVFIAAQLIPLLTILLLWKKQKKITCNEKYSNPEKAPLVWGGIDIALGIVLLFFLGSGYYIGPACIIFVGVLHLLEYITLQQGPQNELKPVLCTNLFDNAQYMGSHRDLM